MKALLLENNCFLILVSVISLTLLNNMPVMPQEVNQTNLYLQEVEHDPDTPYFDVNLFNVAADSASLSRLIIRVSFVNDELQFITTKDKKFRADYEISVTILDTVESEIQSKKWTRFVIAQNFDETNSEKLINSPQVSLDLQPNKYQFKIGLKDIETQRSAVREGWILLRNFSKEELMLSDILFLDTEIFKEDERLRKITDGLAASAEVPKHYAYYEVYDTSPTDSINIMYEILGPENNTIKKGEHRIKSKGRITPDFIELDEDRFFSGDHRLKIEISSKGRTLEAEEPISCVCKISLPLYTDIQDAIEKLIYIAKGDELKRLKKTEGEEQIEEFRKFWEKRDPTPETPENEYMEEYYDRINTANEVFTGTKDGWRTDMGLVYVKLGPPDYIDKPLLYDEFYDQTRRRRPSVIWHYIDLGRQIFFYYRAGEYRIANLNDVNDILYGEMRF